MRDENLSANMMSSYPTRTKMFKQSNYASYLIVCLLILTITHKRVDCLRILDNADDQQPEDKLEAQYKRSLTKPSRQLELARTGWKTITVGAQDYLSSNGPKPVGLSSFEARLTSQAPIKPPLFNSSDKTAIRSGKLIEWDDDDFSEAVLAPLDPLRENSLEATLGSRVSFGDKSSRNSLASKADNADKPAASVVEPKSRKQLALGTGALIFHGQLRANSTRVRVADGVEININTHKPVEINRRSYRARAEDISAPTGRAAPPEEANLSTTKRTLLDEQDTYATSAPKKVKGSIQPTKTTTTTTTTEKPVEREMWNSLISQPGQDTSSSSSDWRPIVVSSRMRRSGKTHRQEGAPLDSTGLRPAKKEDGPRRAERMSLEYKWKPITKAPLDKLFDLNKSKPVSSSNFDPPRSHSKHKSSSAAMIRKFEDPFDGGDEDDLDGDEDGDHRDARSGKSSRSREDERESGAHNKQDEDDVPPKWRPIDSSTASDLMISSTTTTESVSKETTMAPTVAPAHLFTAITTTSAPSSSNGSESAQRSASDLSFIYSSQPQPQPQQQVATSPTGGGSSYYSNYIVQQPQQQQQPQQPQTIDQSQPEAPIVDNTSGQTPEMIVDRTPEMVPPAQQDYYSVPQSVAAFQPAPAPPSRAPPTYYSNNNYAYDTSSFSSVASAFRSQPQPVPQPVPQPATRQQAPAPAPVVRQEHHYHYYNQPPQSPPDRSQTLQQSQPPQQQQQQQLPQPTVIRELQPIMISQPVIQQQAPSSTTTTQAPIVQTQIVREVIREVPIQSPGIQMTNRVMLQQQPIRLAIPALPAQVPIVPPIIRETTSFDSYGSYAAPAKRLMRQLTNSIPQVAIRMPSVTQFRVQVPALQLPPSQPLRVAQANLAPVTRQTGSFIIPPMPKKTTTLLTETQAMPTHTTIMQTTQFTPATRTTVYTTDHQIDGRAASSYK